MKLSIIIPAYNEEHYLSDCLSSITKECAACEYEVEVIVVNNASTDRTKDVAASFKNVVVVDEPRKGLTYARQAGYRAATGELIANVDADTRLPEGWVTKVFDTFLKDGRYVALSGPYIYYDVSPTTRAFVRLFYFFGYLSYLVNHYVFRSGAMLQGGNFIVRRSALEAIGGFDTSIAFYGEDTDVARRLGKVGEVKWTFALPMYTSGRRLRHEGVMTMGVRYALNYIWMHFFKRPFTKEYLDIRSHD